MDDPANEDWAHDSSVPPRIVHLFVAVLFVWLVTAAYLDCEDLQSAKYDHVRFFGLQVYNDLYLDGETGPWLVHVLIDAVVRVFRALFAVCSSIRRRVWIALHTSHSLISAFVRSVTRLVVSIVLASLRSVAKVTRIGFCVVVAPVLVVTRATLSVTHAAFSVYGAVRVVLRSALLLSVAVSLMVLICLVPIVASGIACAGRGVLAILMFPPEAAASGLRALRINIDLYPASGYGTKSAASRMAFKAHLAHDMVRTRCSLMARRGSLLLDNGYRAVVEIVRVGASPLLAGFSRKDLQTTFRLVGDYMRAPWSFVSRWSTADDRKWPKSSLSSFGDMDLSPSHSSGTVSKVEGHVPSVVDAHAPLVGDEVEEFKPNVLVIGRIARNDFDEKDEDARTCSLDVAAESEDDLPVSDDTHHSPVEDVPLVYIGAQDCEPVAKFVERIASVDILDDEEDELAADLPTLSGGEDELVAEPPLAFEGDDDNASFGVLYEDEDELVAPLLAFEDDHDHDDVPAPLATSMSLGALDLVSRDTRPLALDLDCDFDTPHATPGLPKTAAAPQPARDVLSGFQQIPGWRWPDRVPSLLLSVEGATSARGDDGTVSSTPAQYAWAAPPAIYTFPRPPIRFPGPHRHPLPPTPPLPASSDVSAVPAASTASEVSAAPPVPAAPAVSAAPVVSARPAAPAEPRAKKSRPRKRQKKKAAKGKAVVEEPPANATTAEPAVTSAGPAPTAEPEAADAPPLGVFSGVLPFAVEKFKVRGPRTPTAERRRRQKARAAAAEERDRVFRLAAIGELGENYQL